MKLFNLFSGRIPPSLRKEVEGLCARYDSLSQDADYTRKQIEKLLDKERLMREDMKWALGQIEYQLNLIK